MLINANVNLALCVVKRQLHTCVFLRSNVKRQAKMLAKIMTGSHRKKKNWYAADFIARAPVLPQSKTFQSGGQSKRRVDVLNKIFMRSITDLLTVEEVVPELIGRGISITQVKVSQDFSVVKVYWIAKETTHDAELDKVLENAGYELRHHMSQLHVIGKIPKILFLPDKWQNVIEDTLQRLGKAKEIDGFECEDTGSKLKSDESLPDVPIFANVNELEEYVDDDPLPPMTHNVLGLDHEAIMKKIQSAITRSEARHRRNTMFDTSNISIIQNTLDSPNDLNVCPSDIAQYIAKQRIEKKKLLRSVEKNFFSQIEHQSEVENDDDVDLKDEDYIEEFDDMRNDTILKEK